MLQSLQHTKKLLRRQIKYGVKRVTLRGDEDVQRLAGNSQQRLGKRAHMRVKRRFKFAVNLDRYKVSVQELRDLPVAIALALHDVAPVTGEVTNRDVEQLAVASRLRDGVLIPVLPGDRVIGMQGKIW